MATITTRWEKLDDYDVHDNGEDGYTVNDSMLDGEIELQAEVTINNEGTPGEFASAALTDDVIREAFGINPGVAIDVRGDDIHYTISIEEDGYPIGYLCCVSHDSLSPIREKSE